MPGAQSRGLRDITLTFDENMKEVVSLMGESPVFERVSVFSFWIGHCQASVLLLIGVYTKWHHAGAGLFRENHRWADAGVMRACLKCNCLPCERARH